MNNKDFQDLNEVLKDVLKQAMFFLMTHDRCFKKYCLQSASWSGVEKLKKLATLLPEPFFAPVNTCLRECADAKKKMPEINISFKEYPVAVESLTKLAEQIDQILEQNPQFRDGIDDEELVSHQMFVNLWELAYKIDSQLEEAAVS